LRLDPSLLDAFGKVTAASGLFEILLTTGRRRPSADSVASWSFHRGDVLIIIGLSVRAISRR
jgi:hypothetical protein